MATAQVQLPHDLQAVLKGGDPQIHASFDCLNEQRKGRIVIRARELTIFQGDDPSCWKWILKPDTNGARVEVAESLEIDVLDVCKKCPVQQFTPSKYHLVYFVLMMEDTAFGFEGHPVTFKLLVPGQKPTERTQDLSKLPRKTWAVVPVGTFYGDPGMAGELKISMSEHGDQSKGGLIVNKLVILPLEE
ncbi:protein PHLOEM PROTEIN 2-LIKE A1-like isoform X1 [Mangifera indica]|uniref:protein PHLOEM PROTEIN 2-LIKE A1-like isoform X1 n=1 Tax=Mangifera indica TaxID=29780 RepID=UPI001CFB29F7|nr:protein PHLOEM PROTEIN 2-LIKE A1-like isoform X1 [Mangifera indica]